MPLHFPLTVASILALSKEQTAFSGLVPSFSSFPLLLSMYTKTLRERFTPLPPSMELPRPLPMFAPSAPMFCAILPASLLSTAVCLQRRCELASTACFLCISAAVLVLLLPLLLVSVLLLSAPSIFSLVSPVSPVSSVSPVVICCLYLSISLVSPVLTLLLSLSSRLLCVCVCVCSSSKVYALASLEIMLLFICRVNTLLYLICTFL
eukprot:m.35044 g.35044  ORF g.35044 m.35044 type:complete len:207 (+) comp11095_c0_seq2:1309-1929(+)